MRGRNLPSGKMVLGFFVIFLLLVLGLEGITRFLNRGPKYLNPYYVEISKDFPELDELIDNTQMNPDPKYYDEFIYAAAPLLTEHLNYTDYYSARLTPDSVPLQEAKHIVWTFGGSTMENSETTDNLTIANTWAKIFNQNLGPTHIKNFGTGGFFTSYELIKFQKLLREVPETDHPTIAIFYDGYNDSLFGFQYGPGSMQKDLSLKLQAFVENKDFVVATYTTSRMLSGYSKLWDRSGARFVEKLLFPLPEPNTSSRNLTGTVQVYTLNVKMIQATCDTFRIQCYFILQPLIITKKPLSPLEQEVLYSMEEHPRVGPEGTRFILEFYDQVTKVFDGGEKFINASHVLDGRTQSDFYDLGHTSALSSPVIGEETAQLLLTRINSPGN